MQEPDVVLFDNAGRTERFRGELGLAPDRCILFCPGGDDPLVQAIAMRRPTIHLRKCLLD